MYLKRQRESILVLIRFSDYKSGGCKRESRFGKTRRGYAVGNEKLCLFLHWKPMMF
jgi:hypothetical protein